MTRPAQATVEAVLHSLRQRQGIHHRDLYETLDILRPIWHVDASLQHQPDVLREIVETQLEWLLERTADPADTVSTRRENESDRLLIRAAFNYAIPELAPSSFLKDRIAWLDKHLGRGHKTLRHYIDQRLRKFAAVLSDERIEPLSREELRLRIEQTKIPKEDLGPIRDLLEAQVAAARHLPYWSSNAPPLDQIYVEPLLVPDSETERRVTIMEALSTWPHVAIAGAPGAGKSTLAVQTVARLSRLLLENSDNQEKPLIPLYIPARFLVGGTGLIGTVAQALNRWLGVYLRTALTEDVLSQVTQATEGFILFLDGTDEIVDASARRRLLDQLLSHAGTQRPLRLVLIGRNIGNDLPRIGSRSSTHLYKLAPFDLSAARLLVSAWLRAYRVANVELHVDHFVDIYHRRKLLGVLENPLFASIAATLYIAYGQRAPATLFDLYDEFVHCLLYRRQESVRSRVQLKSVFESIGSEGERFAEWLYDHRRQLCSHIAWQFLQGDDHSFADMGREWVEQNYSARIAISALGEHIGRVLVDSGLIIERGASFTFIHHTVAEYLAANLVEENPKLRDLIFDRFIRAEFGRMTGILHFMNEAWQRSFTADAYLSERYSEKPWTAAEFRVIAGELVDRVDFSDRLIEMLCNEAAIIHRGLRAPEQRYGRYLTHHSVPDYTEELNNRRELAFVEGLSVLAKWHEPFVALLHDVVSDSELSFLTRAVALVTLFQVGRISDIHEHLHAFEMSRSMFGQIARAYFYKETGRKTLAVEVLRNLLCSRPHPHFVRRAARLLYDVGDESFAIRCLIEQLNSPNTSWTHTVRAAQLLLKMGLSQSVWRILHRRLEDQPVKERGLAAYDAIYSAGLWEGPPSVDPLYDLGGITGLEYGRNRILSAERTRLMRDPNVSTAVREATRWRDNDWRDPFGLVAIGAIEEASSTHDEVSSGPA